MPTAGLVAHTLVARFVAHLPYFRQEQINARSGVHTPRSALAAWSGAGGASLMPLYEAHRAFLLGAPVLHADETPVKMLVGADQWDGRPHLNGIVMCQSGGVYQPT